MMFEYGSHWAFWQVAMMWVGMVAFWALVIFAIYAVVKSTSQAPHVGPTAEPPADARHILEERLAKGELDVEEYRRLRDALSEGRTPTASAH